MNKVELDLMDISEKNKLSDTESVYINHLNEYADNYNNNDFYSKFFDKHLNVYNKRERQIKLREILYKQIHDKYHKEIIDREDEKFFRNHILQHDEVIYKQRDQ